MTSTGANNWVFGPYYLLRQTLLAVDAFRLRLGASATTAQADKRIHYMHTDDQLEDLHLQRPFAVIVLPSQDVAGYGVSTFNHLRPALSDLVLYMTDNAAPGSEEDSFRDFAEWAGNVLEGLCDLSGTGTYLAIEGVQMSGPPARTKRADRRQGHDFWEITWTLACGIGGGE